MLKIDGYVIDAELSVRPSRENVVCEFPVEFGTDHADHAYARPLVLDLEGVVSDSPLSSVAAERERFTIVDGEAFARPSEEARAKLESIFASREPVTIESSTGTYKDMVCERLEMPRDAGTGKACRFTATFKQITFVTNERTTARIDLPRAKSKKDVGFRACRTAVANFAVGVVDLTNSLAKKGTAALKDLPGARVSQTLTNPPVPPDGVTQSTSDMASRRPVRVGGSGFRTPISTGGS